MFGIDVRKALLAKAMEAGAKIQLACDSFQQFARDMSRSGRSALLIHDSRQNTYAERLSRCKHRRRSESWLMQHTRLSFLRKLPEWRFSENDASSCIHQQ